MLLSLWTLWAAFPAWAELTHMSAFGCGSSKQLCWIHVGVFFCVCLFVFHLVETWLVIGWSRMSLAETNGLFSKCSLIFCQSRLVFSQEGDRYPWEIIEVDSALEEQPWKFHTTTWDRRMLLRKGSHRTF